MATLTKDQIAIAKVEVFLLTAKVEELQEQLNAARAANNLPISLEKEILSEMWKLSLQKARTEKMLKENI
jgi:hypothetical protein